MTQEKSLTGYPSIDKPWLKYYSKEAINASLPECTIYEYLWKNNKECLDDVALDYSGRKITFGRLFACIDKTASAFSALGIKKGDIVTIQSLSLPQVIYMVYALSKIGAVANLIYATSTMKEVNENLEQTKSKLYVTIDSIYIKFQGEIVSKHLQHVILLSLEDEMSMLVKFGYRLKNKMIEPKKGELTWREFLERATQTKVPVMGKSSDQVVMIYTGGTTGKIKGVMLTNYNLNASAVQCANYRIERQSTFLSILPPFIAFGIALTIHFPLSIGAKTILRIVLDASEIAEWIMKNKINYLICGTAQANYMMNATKDKKIDLSSLKWLVLGGDSISDKWEKELNVWLAENKSSIKVSQGYAMSETAASAAISVYTPTLKLFKDNTIGIPLARTNIKIVEENTQKELGYGEVGEICIQSPCIMKGYFQNEEETRNILKIHADGMPWIHTGDIGSIDVDGFITILGRIKRMIPVWENGVFHKLFPKVLEDSFLKTGVIKAISIVGKKDIESIHKLIAYVVLEQGTSSEHAIHVLETYADETMEFFERPVKYIVRESLPLTIIGKVDFRVLEEHAEKESV